MPHQNKYISYKNIYLQTNSTASIYINGFTFFAFPQNTLITTYEITPSAIPSEILYISGIARSARYAGTDSVRSVKSTLIIEDIIRKPTNISAGAVANDGIAVNIGANIIASKT